MQQATTLHTSARARAAQWTIAAIATLALLVTAGTAALSTRAPHAAPIAAVVVNPAHNRLFDSERVYVPSASEYVSLGETYIPAASARPAPQPVSSSRMQVDQQATLPSAAEYAALPWDENYRVPAQPALAVAAPSLDNSSRFLADQRLDVVSAAEYAGLPLAEDDSLTGTPR
jgi:hypothetical protein